MNEASFWGRVEEPWSVHSLPQQVRQALQSAGARAENGSVAKALYLLADTMDDDTALLLRRLLR